MKRYLGAPCWCLLLGLLIVLVRPVLAAGQPITLIIDEQRVETDVAPVIYNDRTMVPLRIISEQLGAQVHWDDATRTVTVGAAANVIELGIGKNVAIVGGERKQLDAAPIIVGDRTMVPLRFIGEALGAEVHWDGSTRTVYVYGAKAEVRQITLQKDVGREIVSVKGTGRLQGTVTQAKNMVIVKLPEAELLIPGGLPQLEGDLVKGVSIRPSTVGETKGVEVVINLRESTPFTVSSEPGELLVLLPYRVEGLDYHRKVGGEVLTIATTGQVPYNIEQQAAPERLVIQLPGIVSSPGLDLPTTDSLLNKAVKIKDGPAGVTVVVEQSRVTKFRVSATASGLEVYFTPQIVDLAYEAVPGGGKVRIRASGELNYQTFSLEKPDRVVVDFQDTILAGGDVSIDVNDETTVQVRSSQFGLDPDVTRLVVELKSYLSHRFELGQQPGELILELSASPVQGRYIGIDAGHGGNDPGAVSPSGLKEKDLNRDMAEKVAAILRAAGARVLMTREGDLEVDLKDRSGLANQEGVEILVSIHCNSFTDRSKRGTEVYYFRDGDGGQELAQALHKALINSLGLPDRGLKTQDYHLVRQTKMPATLVEVAYMSNPVEESLLADPSFRSRAAQAIVDGIMNYFRHR
jgi:N-acetylmuramoyl-L-alanine amidase